MYIFKKRAIYANPEFQSAMVRLGVWVFAVVYVFAGAVSERYQVNMPSFIALFAVYLLFFSGLLISVLMRPVWEERRYFSLVVDISATTFCIYLTGEASSPFFLLNIAKLSRENAPGYAELRRMIYEKVKQINARFGHFC